MANCNPQDLLIPTRTILQSINQDLNKYNQLDKDQATIYYTIVNTTIYLSNITRPDIAYIIRQLARIIAKPNTCHLSITKGLLQYLKGTTTAKITY
jgi:hypothetical protein